MDWEALRFGKKSSLASTHLIELTVADYSEFHRAFFVWDDAIREYNALKSQGKYCPPEALEQASRKCLEAIKAYKLTRVYKLRKSCDRTEFLTKLLP